MSLPNFVNFEPFNALRRKMHAETLGRFEFRSVAKDKDEAAAADQPVTVKPKAKPRRRKAASKAS